MIVVEGDITKLDVDAIVNAANTSLLGGGGVDGAIHRAAGPGLMEECRKLKGCATGQAKMTGGHDLPAKYVIHTVGPVWSDGTRNESNLLADCYRNSLELAAANGVKTIAFPSISTGAYGFPPQRAAVIAVHEVRRFLEQSRGIEEVIFCTFGSQMTEIYHKVLGDRQPNPFITDFD